MLTEHSGVTTGLVFNEAISNKQMERNFLKVLGAGFCFVDTTESKVVAYGDIFSLKVSSRPKEDGVVLTKVSFPNEYL